ncbi:MAG: hypothetical protein ABIH46_07490 [Chloroflexota bacterium]
MPYFMSETQPTATVTGDIWEKPSNHAKKYWTGTEWKPLNIFPVFIELRPDLDFETIRGNAGIPTLVTQGVYRGYSLPVGGANEELFFTICVPNRYDGASDIMVHVTCWLAGAEVNKFFNLEVSWEHYTPTESTPEVVPATTTDVPVETATGNVAAFASYRVEFTLDYDVHTPNNVVVDDILGIRLRRIAAAGAEAIGEIVINHVGVVFRRDKLGTEDP